MAPFVGGAGGCRTAGVFRLGVEQGSNLQVLKIDDGYCSYSAEAHDVTGVRKPL